MKNVKKYTYETLTTMCLGKQIHFTSDCELFHNFDIKCKVLQMKMESGEILFICKLSNGKTITVGSNMRNLQFEVL